MIRRLLQRIERAIVGWIIGKAILSQDEARKIEDRNEQWRREQGIE